MFLPYIIICGCGETEREGERVEMMIENCLATWKLNFHISRSTFVSAANIPLLHVRSGVKI